MNIIYVSPIGANNPRLFPVIKNGLTNNWETDNPRTATHCFIEQQSGDIRYDQEILQIIKDRQIPIICFDSREFGTMRNEKWFPVDLNVDVYFIRNMNRAEDYPDNCYPFDWPYFQECDYEPTTAEELNTRPYDCCFIGTEAPTRKTFIDALIKDGRIKVHYEFRDHTRRFQHYSEWVNEHKKAKLHISCDGGGYTNERPNQLFAIAPMIRNRSNHLPAHSFTDEINCIEVNEQPTEADIDKVIDILNNKEWLYDIYLSGIAHTKKYHSAEATANYILQALKINGL